MKEYCIYTADIDPYVIRDLRSLYTQHEIHLNRTRFYLNDSLPEHVAFALKYSHILHRVYTYENL